MGEAVVHVSNAGTLRRSGTRSNDAWLDSRGKDARRRETGLLSLIAVYILMMVRLVLRIAQIHDINVNAASPGRSLRNVDAGAWGIAL